jgi:beta-phosphoglucomutase family hydrolase
MVCCQQMKSMEPATGCGLSLIFDLDGVVVDSMPVHTLAWERYLEQIGVRAAKDVAARMHGRRNDEIITEFLGKGVPEQEVFEHGAAKERLFRTMMGAELHNRLVSGLKPFLERWSACPTALATNAEPPNVDFVLDGAGLRPFFRVIVDGSQVQNPKPAPDVYLVAAQRLGVPAENCVVFEDSVVGIAAARAAGMRVAGVATHTRELEHVDILIDDFLDPELEPWLSSLQMR